MKIGYARGCFYYCRIIHQELRSGEQSKCLIPSDVTVIPHQSLAISQSWCFGMNCADVVKTPPSL